MLLYLAACFVTEPDRDLASDRDHDGFVAWQLGGEDCDDNNASVNPSAEESCLDQIDSDCDGFNCPQRQELSAQPWGDGFALTGGAHDYDGDGAVELVLSSPVRDGVGAVEVFSLPLNTEGGAPLWAVSGVDDRGLWAWPVGDLDGDGDWELAVSTTGGAGETAILDHLGSDSRFEDAPNRLVSARSTEPGLDVGVSDIGVYGRAMPLGDWDGDGLDDFALASPGAARPDQQDRGAVYVITQAVVGENALRPLASLTVLGDEDRMEVGQELGVPTDMNGDGVLELVTASGNFQSTAINGTNRATGAASVFHARIGEIVQMEDAELVVVGRYANARIMGATSVGDINGDGLDDLGVHLSSGAGQALFFLGPAEGLLRPEHADLRLVADAGTEPTTHFGTHLVGGFDLNDDDHSELLVGAPQEGLGDSVPERAGAHYLFYGPLSGVLTPDHAAARWQGLEERSESGPMLVGDFDQDGQLDLLIESWGASQLDVAWSAFAGL